MLGHGMLMAAAGAARSYKDVVLADGPLAYWRMQETSGSTLVDSSGNGYQGAYVPGISLGQAPIVNCSGCVSANGVNSSGFATVNANAGLFPSVVTAECWIKTASTLQGGLAFITQQFNNNPISYALGLTLASTLGDSSGYYPFFGAYNSGWRGTISQTQLQPNTIYHLVGIYDGTYYSIYINGVLANKTAGTGVVYSGRPLFIGRRWDETGSTPYFRGNIEEVAIYNKALTAAQILAHYNAGT